MAERRQSEVGQVRVRGSKDGIVMQLPADVPLPELLGQVRACIDGGGAFFHRAQIVLDYADRVPNVEEIAALKALLAERDIALRTVTTDVAAHRDLLWNWGYHPLRVVTGDPREGRADPPGVPESERTVLYVRRTLRSGASVQFDGDVLILGDVNAGAEVLARGDVIVWGTIRGTVHAGIDGDFDAIIGALRLKPMQLRIGTIFARPPDQEDWVNGPVLARVQNKEIVVEPWHAERRTAR